MDEAVTKPRVFYCGYAVRPRVNGAIKRSDGVRIDIPDETDPDYEAYHDHQGKIVEILDDDAGEETMDERDSIIYRVEFDNSVTWDFRWRDLRPAFDEPEDAWPGFESLI